MDNIGFFLYNIKKVFKKKIIIDNFNQILHTDRITYKVIGIETPKYLTGLFAFIYSNHGQAFANSVAEVKNPVRRRFNSLKRLTTILKHGFQTHTIILTGEFFP